MNGAGHGPILEQDIALTNIALDFMGQARNWLSYAVELEGQGRSEDDLAYLRDVMAFRNVLLVEQPNEDWAHTIIRQFLFDSFNYFLHKELCESQDERVAAIAKKSLKEISYHLRFSSEWTIRLGDGTELSRKKMQNALDALWMYSGELIQADALDQQMAKLGIGGDLEKIALLYQQHLLYIFKEASLSIPQLDWMQSGGKAGRHTEHLGYILADMQFLQRAYPGAKW